MALEHFEYDPHTGITTKWDFDADTGNVVLRREQDIQAALDYAAEVRNTGAGDRKYVKHKKTVATYAIIPIIVQMELLKKGIDICDKNAMPALLREIEVNYPYLKLTDKKHLINHL